MNLFSKIYKNNYKALLIIPFLLLVLAIGQISYQMATTGDFINKGVSLKGGLTITIPYNDVSAPDLQTHLQSKFAEADIHVRALSISGTNTGVIVDADITKAEEIAAVLESLQEKTGDLNSDEFTIENVGSSLGESFFRDTIKAMIFAFILMGIVVFYYFRIPIPSLAVILAAFSDIVVSIAVVNLMGIKISTGGIAAFLMLIGYSVDTDILLSTRVLKRHEGTVLDRVYNAMKTGLTMNFTTMAAILVALVMTTSPVLEQIMTILLIGLFIDIINTWIQNAGILRWYMEKKNV